MKEELFRKIIDELSDIDFDGRISITYGEPLLDKRLLSSLSTTTAPRSNTGSIQTGIS
jgi:hypothetical protein